jgi:hypothetical protein
VIIFGIVMAPFWSAFTEAYSKGDFGWIKKILAKLKILLIPETVGLVVMVVLSKYIFQIWIGNKLSIPFDLVVLNAVYVLVYSWTNIYVYFMNGINKLNLQLGISVFTLIINIPLCFYFAKTLGMGNSGIMIAQILTALPGAVIYPIYIRRIYGYR